MKAPSSATPEHPYLSHSLDSEGRLRHNRLQFSEHIGGDRVSVKLGKVTRQLTVLKCQKSVCVVFQFF